MPHAPTTIASVVLAALTAAGCSGPTTPTPLTASGSMAPLTASGSSSAGGPTLATASAGHHASRLPISGTCDTTFGPPLSPPPVIRQVDTGTCQLAHLGRTAIYSLQDIDVVAGTQTSLELTFTAANGDVLRGRNAGTHVQTGPASSRFSGTTTLSGGTGRFANATGQWRLEGTVDRTTSSAAFTIIEGWITYDASDRSAR